ncbi:FAD-binding oxidoreductase [Actinoalloteichus hymeniacidonis]|uniref:FAD/FMN-dependent dehydrogenase n=1 Tax=Actinoalloteichus hymeniacidonis TaxID=340345 RepID=A0AAC9HQX5_9PSEU|nr:FAD-binding oxidoreductase [Actinoalloteichus hymeniacidonis]AOS63774.1 FAD/FMN-dependent dehydrogenase [Actinoalloteichus hymeniacidonis]MBB5908172.1 hypothetical protein [Actinoalloteichus hymeniacidonis]
MSVPITDAERASFVEIARRELEPNLVGAVLSPADTGYDQQRMGFNRTVESRPVFAVAARGASDVVHSVRFAARHGLPVAVQATGHGPSVTGDDALLIGTSAMDGVRLDPDARTVRIEAGVRWGRVVREAATYGLAPLNGSSLTVGAVSFVLGGGIGPLGRSFGYAADRVRSLDVVTADGCLRVVTPDREPELFWALRGGKGNFGVVTSIEVDLFPVTTVYGGGLFMPGASLSDLIPAWRDWAATMPPEMHTAVGILRFPELDDIPAPLRGNLVGHLRFAYRGDAAEGERLIRPLRGIAEPVLDTVAELPYPEVGSINGDPSEPGSYYDRSGRLRGLDDRAIDTLLESVGPQVGSPITIVEIRALGGALADAPAVPNAVPFRSAGYTLFCAGMAEGSQVPVLRSAQRQLLDDLEPWRIGGPFLSFITSSENTVDAMRSAYEPTTYARLVQAKDTYDPTNLFRINHNIPPTGWMG